MILLLYKRQKQKLDIIFDINVTSIPVDIHNTNNLVENQQNEIAKIANNIRNTKWNVSSICGPNQTNMRNNNKHVDKFLRDKIYCDLNFCFIQIENI